MVCGVTDKSSLRNFACNHVVALSVLALAVTAVALGLLGYYKVEDFADMGHTWSTNLMVGGAIVGVVTSLYLLIRACSLPPMSSRSESVSSDKMQAIKKNAPPPVSEYVEVRYGLFADNVWRPLRVNGRDVPRAVPQQPIAAVNILLRDSPSQPIDNAKRGTREPLHLSTGEIIPPQMKGTLTTPVRFGSRLVTEFLPSEAHYFSATDLRLLPPEMRQRAREENVKGAGQLLLLPGVPAAGAAQLPPILVDHPADREAHDLRQALANSLLSP